ncbi:MAG TPA: acylphosphatase [Steroidobacteraceae bacterium]|jgi:acylphosphatase
MNRPSPPQPPPIARRCLISGRVQGVYYRASAQQRARGAGITGHARNLADGRVEVLAYGDEGRMREFIEWLWIGPSAAKVTDVVVEVLESPAVGVPTEFRTA